MTDALDITLRAMQATDLNYILSSWLRSYAESREARAQASRAAYFEDYEPIVKKLISRSTVLVVTLTEEPDIVLAWRATMGPVLHYVLVKPRWRRMGIATSLLDDLRGQKVLYTHETPDGMRWPVPETWQYRPMWRFLEAA